MKNKIALIGIGNVGIAILYNLFLTESNLDIILIDHHKNNLIGNIIDLSHTVNTKNNIVSMGDYKKIDDVDVLIISAGIKNDVNRNLFLQKSYLMIKELMDNVLKTKFHGSIIVVSNPNDVLTTYVAKRYQKEKVIGTGTLLDSNRLKCTLQQKFNLKDTSSIKANVIGEHGLSQVILWYKIKINGQKISDILTKNEKKEIEDEVATIAHKIVSLKGYTNFGIASCVNLIINLLLKNQKIAIPISSYDDKTQVAYSYLSKIKDGKVIRNKVSRIDYNLVLSSIKKIENEYRIFENSIVVGIDLDDTITDMKKLMQDEALKFDKSINGKGIIDNTKYLVGEQYDWNEEEKDRFFKEYRVHAIENAKVREDVNQVLKKMLKLGYKIIIITARSSKYYENPYEYTKNWLNKHKIPYTKLIVNATSKKDVCKKENVSIFLDDMPNNCLEVSKLDNVKVYIMDNGNNLCEQKEIKRVKNFEEFYREVV